MNRWLCRTSGFFLVACAATGFGRSVGSHPRPSLQYDKSFTSRQWSADWRTATEAIKTNGYALASSTLNRFQAQASNPEQSKAVVTWPSVRGHSYAIEISNFLPAPSWTPLATGVSASGGPTTTYLDTSTGATGKRYYRVRIE